MCIVGFAPTAFGERPTLVTRATAERLRVAGWLLGVADTYGRSALAGDPVDVWVGETDLAYADRTSLIPAPRLQGPLLVDLGRENPALLDGALAEFEAYELVGDLSRDASVLVPQEPGWSARFLDRTTNRRAEPRTVTIISDLNGARVTTTPGIVQRVRVEFYGGNFNAHVHD